MGFFSRAAYWVQTRGRAKGLSSQDTRLARMGSVLPSRLLSNQFTRIGGGVTPRQVSAILREADTGYIHRYVDLLNDSRQKDCHMQSLLGTREAALVGLRWAMVPRSKEDEDFVRAEFAEQALKNATGMGGESRGFVDMISHLTGATYYGHSHSETEWEVDSIDGRTALIPVGFHNHSQRRFRFSEMDGKLGFWDSDNPTSIEPLDLQKIFPNKFIKHQPRVNGDIPSREGLGRVLIWSALFRNWGMSDWMRLAELAWKPWRIGKYKSDASVEEIDGLRDALDLLTTNGVGLFSERVDMSVEWPERGRGGKPEHEMLLEYLGQEMSKCVLGQTLTVESGERGARSLGEVHDRVRKDLREIDAISVAATINRDLVEPMMRMNFGADRPPPIFMFITDDTIDIGALARAIDALVRAGLKIPQDWARDKAGIPDPDPEDEILLGRTYVEAENGLMSTNVQQWQGDNIKESPEDPEEDDDDDDSEDEDDDGGSVDNPSGSSGNKPTG